MDANCGGFGGWITIRTRAWIIQTSLWGALGLAVSPALAASNHERAAKLAKEEAAAQAARSYVLREPRAGESTVEFFTQALNNHWLHVDIPVSMRHLEAEANGLLPDTVFVEYLKWRHDLNPVRFDFYHPKVGPMIERDEILRASLSPKVIVEPTAPPPNLGQTLTPPPHCPNIPEPGTATIAVVMLAAAALARRWAQRRG